MAKKPTKAKRTTKIVAKASKAKSSKNKSSKRPAAPPIEPTYLAPGGTIRIGLHDVVRAIKMIEKSGQLGKFISAARKKQAQVTLPADTVNFAKDFVVKYRLHGNAIGKHIVNGRGLRATTRGLEGLEAAGDPNQCNFGTGR
jgi:hypothetical protein